MDILQVVTELSHEFGTEDYVRGGGGNTSCKNEHTIWVKPSGKILRELQPENFVALDRDRLSRLYQLETPVTSSECEKIVKEIIEQAVLPLSKGRASVEAPLHDLLNARYVVHTHPFIVNGMTCSREGAAVCRELFSTALWLDYIDPGYTLSMRARKEIKNYKHRNGCEPSVIFLKNHGVFVAADEPQTIHAFYADIMSKLKTRYERASISLELEIAPLPQENELKISRKVIRDAMQNPNLFIAAAGAFEVAMGPISPDHIVYSKSYPFIGKPTVKLIEKFRDKHGYTPQVFAFHNAVFGVSENERSAALALELAQDGALVEKLACAFGGINYMTKQSREFIENWEVESYRKRQIES